MSVNDAIKDMLYGHEHRWRVAEHELAQARAEAAALREEVEAMRELLANNWPCRCGHPLCKRCRHDAEVLDALRARKVACRCFTICCCDDNGKWSEEIASKVKT